MAYGAATPPTLTATQAKQQFVEEQTALRQAAARGLPIVSAMAADNRRMIALQPALDLRDLKQLLKPDKYQAIADNILPLEKMALCPPGSVMAPVVRAVYPDKPPDMGFVCLRAESAKNPNYPDVDAVRFPGLPLNGLGAGGDVSTPSAGQSARENSGSYSAVALIVGLGIGYLLWGRKKK